MFMLYIFSDIDFSLLFGPPVSYIEIPSIPKFSGEELSLCFIVYLYELNINTFQNIFQLYETTTCQMIASMEINSRSVVIHEDSTNTTINHLNLREAPTPICFRWSAIKNKWSVSIRGKEIGSKPIQTLPSAMTPSTISLNLGGPDVVDNLEVCKVPETPTERSFNGKMFYVMIYNIFISDNDVENQMMAKWKADDSLLMTMQDFKDLSQYAKGNVTKGEIFTS